jgi:phosphatidylglycerophosphate synthase
MAKIGAAKSVAVSFVGKLKTAVQMTAIPLLLWHNPILNLNAQVLGEWLLWAAALLTLWSMAYYLLKASREISAVNR